MRKIRPVLVAVAFSAVCLTGCADEANDLKVEPIEQEAAVGGQGSGGGDNPPPSN